MKNVAYVLLILFMLAPASYAQEKSRESGKKQEKIRFDFTYKYDPQELHQYWRDLNRWKRLKGIFGIGSYHIPLALEPGPYYGPPTTIWGQGFGTSLWRDPITGRPIT
jgi:hypothetical protein